MKLYIDNREPKKIINLITILCEDKCEVEVKSLQIGDYIICDSNDKTLIIFERILLRL